MMEIYGNKSGNSGILDYEIGSDYIKVRFDGNASVYLYTYRSAGKHAIEKMKLLAKSGKGLSTYISRKIREKYESVE